MLEGSTEYSLRVQGSFLEEVGYNLNFEGYVGVYRWNGGGKGGSPREIMQLAQQHTVRLSSHFTVILKSYIYIYKKSCLFESCHQPTYFMHVLIFINEGLNFPFLFLKLSFLFYDFYHSFSHDSSCSKYFLMSNYVICTGQVLGIQI